MYAEQMILKMLINELEKKIDLFAVCYSYWQAIMLISK